VQSRHFNNFAARFTNPESVFKASAYSSVG
jgi:hypothetical protein